MAYPLDLGRYASAQEVVAPTASATADPVDIGDAISTRSYSTARTFFAYVGTVSACVVRMWVYNDGTWYEAASSDDGVALTGSNEVRDWDVGTLSHIHFQVESISGGGTVQILVRGIA